MHAAAAEADGLASLAPAAARLLSGETSAGSRLRELVHSASLCQRTALQAAAASRAFAPLPPVAYFLRAAGEAGPNGGSDAAAAVAWPAGLCRQALVRGVIVAHCRSGALVRLTNAWPPGVAPVAGQERSGARKLKPSTLALLHASHALPAGLLLPRSPALGGAPAFEEVMRRRAPTDATVTAVALSVHDGSIVDGADGGGGGRGGGDNGGGGGGSDGGGVRICISILAGDCEASGLRPLLGCSAAPPGFSTGSAPSPRFLEGRGACWLTLRERVEELPPRPLDALRAALDIPQHASALAPPPTRTHAAGAAAGGRRAFESCRREQNLLWAAEAVRRGVAHARAGRQAEALAAYGHALELDPSHVDALVARGAQIPLALALTLALCTSPSAPRPACRPLQLALCTSPSRLACSPSPPFASLSLSSGRRRHSAPASVSPAGACLINGGRLRDAIEALDKANAGSLALPPARLSPPRLRCRP